MKAIFFTVILLINLIAFSQAIDEKEKLIRQKIKLKNYPGGFEEEPLKVQTQLNSVTRKMAPVQEVGADAPAAGDTAAHD